MLDKKEKSRICAVANADGQSGVSWFDKNENERISAGIEADGIVLLPTTDLSLRKTPSPKKL